MGNYMDLNGRIIDVEVLGQPKTIRLEGPYKGEFFSAPIEVWVAALVSMLSVEQKDIFFTHLKSVESTKEYSKIQQARVVADVSMPRILDR